MLLLIVVVATVCLFGRGKAPTESSVKAMLSATYHDLEQRDYREMNDKKTRIYEFFGTTSYSRYFDEVKEI